MDRPYNLLSLVHESIPNAIAFFDWKYLDSSTADEAVSMSAFDCLYDVVQPALIGNNLDNYSRQVDLILAAAVYRRSISLWAVLTRVIDGYPGSYGDYVADDRVQILESGYTPD